MRKSKIFIINGFILTITSLILKGSGLLFNIYIANKVGQETIGIFSLVMSLYTFAITLASAGIGLSCTCIVAEEFEKKNFNEGLKCVQLCIFFSTIISIITSFLLILLAPIFTEKLFYNNISNIPLYLISIGLPFISVSSVISAYFTSIGKSYKNALSQIFELIIKIIVTILLMNLNIRSNISSICSILLLADIISEFCSFAFNIILYKFELKNFKLKRNYTKKICKKIIKKSIPLAFTSYVRSRSIFT